MSYQVLARKWRPRSFAELVGQEHVLRALVNALDNDRLHHAFLFTGTRGVGKTTIARILAKSLNCETGTTSRPCGQCSACREIDEGRFVDLIEVDAASRTKVEDTRELLENVQYAPTRGRYKVYLIDEVHMLSGHSFNALLKTLEEPPPHVKFLLATTDPQRLPVTILSRCLQFNLKRLSPELIQGRLRHILEQEAITTEPGALPLLARAADGSLRDALSLLDQAIAYGGGQLLEREVRAMLGTIDRDHVYALLRALAARDANALLAISVQLAELAPDYAEVLAELITLLHRIALAQIAPDAIGAEQTDGETIAELARLISPEDVQLDYQIALLGRRDLPLSPDPSSGFEMTLLRMLAFRPSGQAAAPPSPAQPGRASASVPSPAPTQRAAPAAAPSGAPTPRATASTANPSWPQLVHALAITGLTRQLALNCSLTAQEGDAFTLTLEPSHTQLLTKKQEERLQQALEAHFGRPIRLTITIGKPGGETPAALIERTETARRREAAQAIEGDAVVTALVETFNGQIAPDSIRPTDS